MKIQVSLKGNLYFDTNSNNIKCEENEVNIHE